MSQPRTLVVFYSRTGTTRKLAEVLGSVLSADVEEIIDTKPRMGMVGYMRCGFEGNFQRPSVIEKPKCDVASYDLVLVGTPVWARSLSSPVRTFLMQQGPRSPRVAFFCSYGGSETKMAFDQMTALTKKPAEAILALRNAQVNGGDYVGQTEEFARGLSRS